jgi:RNA polymerase sigma factor (TIGR02999 family)
MPLQEEIENDDSGADGNVTVLLRAARGGDMAAVDQLFVALYQDLHRLARSKLRKHRAITNVDTTTVLHESYLRLNRLSVLDVEDRNHFFTYAARVMRSVIVDLVRSAQTERRGGGQMHVTLNTEVSNSVAEDDLLSRRGFLAASPRLKRLMHLGFPIAQFVATGKRRN